jgi:hypothetical protein
MPAPRLPAWLSFCRPPTPHTTHTHTHTHTQNKHPHTISPQDELGDGEQPDGDSSSTSSNADNAWELVSRWLAGGEAWGATQHASVQVAA